MSQDLTNDGADALYDYLAETAAVYVGLITAVADKAAGSVTEVSGGSYGRVDASSAWAASASGTKTTDTLVDFGTPSGDWGTVTHFGLWAASTGGTPLLVASLTSSQACPSGAPVTFPIGDLSIARE